VHIVQSQMHSLLALVTTSCMSVRSNGPVVDVAIIGGGPCGLATALAISKARCLRGAAVEVFESDAFGPKGASIGLSDTGWAALEGIDAEAAERVRATGALFGPNMLSHGRFRVTPGPCDPTSHSTQVRLSPSSTSAPWKVATTSTCKAHPAC